ncbi:hypothetical protein [Sedimenticola hydrogenitrophicus]|uniref:hypothetical protein n=1 Tax=Sedimenticola hydrogenitrophicus TaxID=2967975 RepID=UPI0021A4A3C7|nr:hypothetical protein [Sedimenticola hydrogenitrophicus]
MSMKVTRLYTYWSPAEAQTIIEFLDRLRDQLWDTYGDQIISLLQEASVSQDVDELQAKLEFDDDIEF